MNVQARCPELVVDDYGGSWPCRAIAQAIESVVWEFLGPSNSRREIWARTVCDAGHPCHIRWDELDLLG